MGQDPRTPIADLESYRELNLVAVGSDRSHRSRSVEGTAFRMDTNRGNRCISALLVCAVVRVLLRILSVPELQRAICTQVSAAVGAAPVPELYL